MPDQSHGAPALVTPPAYGSARTNVGQGERIASVLAGSALAGLGATRRSALGWALTSLGGLLLWRGVAGRCPAYAVAGVSTARDQPDPVRIARSVTVARPRAEVYAFWRDLQNLPRFMGHLRRVAPLTDRLWHWVAKGPGPLPDLTWDAEIVEDRPGEALAWRSLPGADVDNAGRVRFEDAADGGTVVHVQIAYHPPAGAVGHVVAGWLSPLLGAMVEDDVHRFQHVIEGDAADAEGDAGGSTHA